MQSVKFTKPPLIEVVFGINIEIPELSLVHFGLYWETIKDKFPNPVETFGELELAEDSSYVSGFPTLWYLSSEENRLIRLTENYFSYHCRCINEDYKHFATIFQEFLNEWRNLKSYWSEKVEKDIKIEGCTLQYINLIDDSSGWNKPEDNEKIFSFFDKKIETSLGFPLSTSWKLKFNLPEETGELIVNLEQQEFKTSDTKAKDLLIFTLSAVGYEDNITDLDDWFIYSHDSIIQSFLDLTTAEVQEIWGLSYE